MSAADIRDEIERIVAEVQRPEAQDLAYYATLMSDFQALLWRPEWPTRRYWQRQWAASIGLPLPGSTA